MGSEVFLTIRDFLKALDNRKPPSWHWGTIPWPYHDPPRESQIFGILMVLADFPIHYRGVSGQPRYSVWKFQRENPTRALSAPCTILRGAKSIPKRLETRSKQALVVPPKSLISGDHIWEIRNFIACSCFSDPSLQPDPGGSETDKVNQRPYNLSKPSRIITRGSQNNSATLWWPSCQNSGCLLFWLL